MRKAGLACKLGIRLCALCMLLAVYPARSATVDDIPDVFDDQPLADALALPDWFKLSFLNLPDDLSEAVKDGKRGLIVYFGQKLCAYCKMHLERNWGQTDIVAYTRANFDVVAVDVRGNQTVVDFDGDLLNEKTYSVKHRTNFTPSLIFYDTAGKVALKLSGYYPPYKFRAALEYVADAHYKQESFRNYLARAEPIMPMASGELNEDSLFVEPPYVLDRRFFAAPAASVVFFEQGHCHACDVLHAGPMRDPQVRQLLRPMEVVQLDMWSDVPVLRPDGRYSTARQWADELGLYYAPTLMFLDERGKEIIRVDSVVQLYRLRNVLTYVASGAYRIQPNFQLWREQTRR